MRYGLWMLTTLAMCVIHPAYGQDYGTIYKCEGAKGHMSYQNSPCSRNQRITGVKPYQGVYARDPQAAERLRQTQDEMDQRNRSTQQGIVSGSSTRHVFDSKRCRNAMARRDRVIQQEGSRLRRDTKLMLDREVLQACTGD